MKMLTGTALDRFNAYCKAVALRGQGISLRQLGDAGALARELEKDTPDAERVELLARRLGLEVEAVGS